MPVPDHSHFDRGLRIACYGYAERDAGSVSSAGYVILRELLDRGHEVDFFGKPSFAYPVGLDQYANFRFVNTEGRAERSFGWAAGRGPRLWRATMGSLTSGQTVRNVGAAISAQHARREYAVQLYLGTWAFSRVPGLPTVSWVQGPPGTDSRSTIRHAARLLSLEGVPRFLALRTYAAYSETLGLPPFRHSDVVICGSRWSVNALRRYVRETVRMAALPYPVDLSTFRPAPDVERSSPPEVLWLGRSVPRKRLDLFLAACEELIAAGRPLTVRVIGGFGFAPGYRRLLEQFRYPDRLRWTGGVPRAEVPVLLQRAAVLVQPSEEENFGSSVAEALACGTPVVVSPTNGTGDYIGTAGRIASGYTVRAVGDAIATVLDGVAEDPVGWPAQARAVAERAFDVKAVVDRLERVLRSAAYGGKVAPANVAAFPTVP